MDTINNRSAKDILEESKDSTKQVVDDSEIYETESCEIYSNCVDKMDQNELTKFVHLMVLLKKMTYFTTLDDRLRNELQLLINVNVNNNLQKKQLTNFKKKH